MILRRLTTPEVVVLFAALGLVAEIKAGWKSASSKKDDVEDLGNEKQWNDMFKLSAIPGISEEECYKGVGCFRRGDKNRLTHPFVLPKPPKYVRTKFYVYNREKRYGHRLRVKKLSKDAAPFFKTPKDLIVLIHGYQQDVNSSWLHELKEALLDVKDCNVIVVDWGRGCRSPKYLSGVGNTALVGRQTSLLLQELAKAFPEAVTRERMHVIGFSLGAQTAGFVGRHFKKTTGKKLARISALDAARPLFEQTNVYVTRKDAVFVDAIHTSSGWTVLQKSLGMGTPFAHVDFYPNGGRDQPGCGGLLEIDCDHGRAPLYYIESVKRRDKCRFLSFKCKGGIKAFRSGECRPGPPDSEMGFYSIETPGRGLRFLKTNSKSPFCKVLKRKSKKGGEAQKGGGAEKGEDAQKSEDAEKGGDAEKGADSQKGDDAGKAGNSQKSGGAEENHKDEGGDSIQHGGSPQEGGNSTEPSDAQEGGKTEGGAELGYDSGDGGDARKKGGKEKKKGFMSFIKSMLPRSR